MPEDSAEAVEHSESALDLAVWSNVTVHMLTDRIVYYVLENGPTPEWARAWIGQGEKESNA